MSRRKSCAADEPHALARRKPPASPRNVLLQRMSRSCASYSASEPWKLSTALNNRSLASFALTSARRLSVTSRIELATRRTPPTSSGLRLISIGNSVPSLRRPNSSRPVPIGRGRRAPRVGHVATHDEASPQAWSRVISSFSLGSGVYHAVCTLNCSKTSSRSSPETGKLGKRRAMFWQTQAGACARLGALGPRPNRRCHSRRRCSA